MAVEHDSATGGELGRSSAAVLWLDFAICLPTRGRMRVWIGDLVSCQFDIILVSRLCIID